MSLEDTPRGPIPDSYWLIPGALLAGEYLGTYIERDTREKLAKVLDAGVRTFIAGLRLGTPDGRLRSPESDEQCRYVREWCNAEGRRPKDEG